MKINARKINFRTILKRITLVAISCVLLCTLLAGCAPADDNDDTPTIRRNPVTMNKVNYNGWRDFISNDEYVINSEVFGGKMTEKFDLNTGEITGVCLKDGCKHDRIQISNYNSEICPIPNACHLLFTHGDKIYYRYRVDSLDEAELILKGSTQPVHTWLFAEYDIKTGEYTELLSIVKNDVEQMLTFIHDEEYEYIYYLRYIPKEPEAQTQTPTREDYKLSFCRMSFEKHEQEVLFALDDCCDIASDVIPDPLAVINGVAYFTCNPTGQLFKFDLDGKNFSYLIDGKHGFLGLFDAYGTFYREGKIYFCEYAQEKDPTIQAHDALIPYSIDCETGELRKISDDYVRWLFVTDDSIFYEMSHIQPEGNKSEGLPADSSGHIIKELSIDDTDMTTKEKNRYIINGEHTVIKGVWGAGYYLFFETAYREDTADVTILDMYTSVLNLEDGSVIEYGKTSGAAEK